MAVACAPASGDGSGTAISSLPVFARVTSSAFSPAVAADVFGWGASPAVPAIGSTLEQPASTDATAIETAAVPLKNRVTVMGSPSSIVVPQPAGTQPNQTDSYSIGMCRARRAPQECLEAVRVRRR